MDGLNYVCQVCQEFTDIDRLGFISIDGDFVTGEGHTNCCNTNFETYTDEEVDDFKAEDLTDLSPLELDSREYLLYQALRNEGYIQ